MFNVVGSDKEEDFSAWEVSSSSESSSSDNLETDLMNEAIQSTQVPRVHSTETVSIKPTVPSTKVGAMSTPTSPQRSLAKAVLESDRAQKLLKLKIQQASAKEPTKSTLVIEKKSSVSNPLVSSKKSPVMIPMQSMLNPTSSANVTRPITVSSKSSSSSSSNVPSPKSAARIHDKKTVNGISPKPVGKARDHIDSHSFDMRMILIESVSDESYPEKLLTDIKNSPFLSVSQRVSIYWQFLKMKFIPFLQPAPSMADRPHSIYALYVSWRGNQMGLTCIMMMKDTNEAFSLFVPHKVLFDSKTAPSGSKNDDRRMSDQNTSGIPVEAKTADNSPVLIKNFAVVETNDSLASKRSSPTAHTIVPPQIPPIRLVPPKPSSFTPPVTHVPSKLLGAASKPSDAPSSPRIISLVDEPLPLSNSTFHTPDIPRIQSLPSLKIENTGLLTSHLPFISRDFHTNPLVQQSLLKNSSNVEKPVSPKLLHPRHILAVSREPQKSSIKTISTYLKTIEGPLDSKILTTTKDSKPLPTKYSGLTATPPIGPPIVKMPGPEIIQSKTSRLRSSSDPPSGMLLQEKDLKDKLTDIAAVKAFKPALQCSAVITRQHPDLQVSSAPSISFPESSQKNESDDSAVVLKTRLMRLEEELLVARAKESLLLLQSAQLRRISEENSRLKRENEIFRSSFPRKRSIREVSDSFDLCVERDDYAKCPEGTKYFCKWSDCTHSSSSKLALRDHVESVHMSK